MSTVRLRRLKADFERLSEYVRRHPRLRLIQSEGDPPEKYQLEYQVKSLRMVGGELQVVPSHIVEIALPLTYPRTAPQCRMLSPVFHPNIAPHAICVGDHWGAGESLQSIVARIGEMLAFQSYNVKSPLNGEAARWVEGNKERLPLDRVSLLIEEDDGRMIAAAGGVGVETPPSAANGQPVKAQSRPPSTSEIHSDLLPVKCTHCGAGYRLPRDIVGRKARCKKCMQVFVATPASVSPAEGGAP